MKEPAASLRKRSGLRVLCCKPRNKLHVLFWHCRASRAAGNPLFDWQKKNRAFARPSQNRLLLRSILDCIRAVIVIGCFRVVAIGIVVIIVIVLWARCAAFVHVFVHGVDNLLYYGCKIGVSCGGGNQHPV